MRRSHHPKVGSMMRPYWLLTYALQLVAVLMLFLALPMQWHAEQGTGLQVLDRALRVTIPLVLSPPIDTDGVPVSQWWIVWAIPVVSAVIGIRALTGLMFTELKGQRILVLVLCLGLFVGYGWYYVNFSDDIQNGFWMNAVAGVGLFVALLIELTLPDVSAQERRLLHLPPDHPARIDAGYSRECHNCGAYNQLEARQCEGCGIILYPDG